MKPIRGFLVFDHVENQWEAGALGISLMGMAEKKEDAISDLFAQCQKAAAKVGRKRLGQIDIALAKDGDFFSLAGKDLKLLMD
jgi:hypothetical protein